MAVESAGRCSLHCAESFFSDDSESSLGDELSTIDVPIVEGVNEAVIAANFTAT